MFPQSELENYKLQVELLQEKLKRSEISRQHLEHKLDKILQKRDEHDKLLRSKAKEKYQQFLEEQQRRNERNKQLVQMLERIEQQTEAMNARSERLKMMKLQYEMYFAKLVHSQTRRCIQSSVNPVTPIMPTFCSQHVQSQQPVTEGYSYVTNIEKKPDPFIPNPYQSCSTTFYGEKEKFLKSQPANVTSWQTTEMPTLDNFLRVDVRNPNSAPSMQTQQIYEHQAQYGKINNNMVDIRTNNKQEITDSNNLSYYNVNANQPFVSVANSLANDKQLPELKENSNLSATTTNFGETSNSDVMPLKVYPNTITKIPNNIVTNENTTNNDENYQPQHNTQYVNQKCKNATNISQNVEQKNNINSIPQVLENEVQGPFVKKVNEHQTQDKSITKSHEKLTLDSTNTRLDTYTTRKSPNNTDNVNRPPTQTEPIQNDLFANNIESNSTTTPVSIENIENKIYGELLSPLETEEVEKPEKPTGTQKLLKNLVAQPEDIEPKNIASEQPIIERDISPNKNSTKDETSIDLKSEQNIPAANCEQNAAYENYQNDQQPEELANSFADYNNYENVDESQQQQYDYSNYDPTQYSYPGYIYDETTGEYKPDPNAPAEQYATDQQYASEGYDQQYQQQDYDYNQAYAESATASSAAAEDTAYKNYDTLQQETSSNLTPEINAEQQEINTQPEPTDLQSDSAAEDGPSSSNKVTKPTSILSTADKNDAQKKKKRVNFIDSSETDESAKGVKLAAAKSAAENLAGSSESDFDFSSSTEAEAKAT